MDLERINEIICSMDVEGVPEWEALRETKLPLANEMHRSEFPRLVAKGE